MLDKLSLSFFIFSLSVAVFLFGISVGHYQIFPFQSLWKAKKTFDVMMDEDYYGEFLKFSDTTIDDVGAARLRSFANASNNGENFLIFGGLNQYLDLCPEHGCLAVELAPDGDVIHAYPYFPEEIYAANSTEDYPYEYVEFDPVQGMRPIGIERFPDGDLLVTFQSSRFASLFPFGTGVSRVDREGQPRWFRFDYSHHWPSPIRGDELLVPAMSIGEAPVSFAWPGGDRHTLDCDTNRPHRDSIRFLDGDGQIVREISVLDAILESQYATVLQHTTDGCDPLHLNYIDVVRADVPTGIEGVAPGDLIVSLRNISAFGFIDAQSGHLKRLVRGAFIQQHSVQHLSGSRFLMFDNQGGGHEGALSRLLEVDLATGAERTLFPTAAHTDDQRAVFSRHAGHLSISPDRTRLIANFSYQGIAFEIRLSDGEVLREFISLHDVSGVDVLADERHEQAAIFRFFGINYVPR